MRGVLEGPILDEFPVAVRETVGTAAEQPPLLHLRVERRKQPRLNGLVLDVRPHRTFKEEGEVETVPQVERSAGGNL